MQHLTITFPDKEDISLLIKDAIRELIPEISKQSSLERKLPEYLTRAEIVKKYHISLVTLHNHTKQGLPSIKIGKRRLYSCDVIEGHFNKKYPA